MTRHLGLLLGVAVAAAAWVLLAPLQLGGAASYVVVEGSSMEPALGRGDLAIVRRAESPRAGDVVAYRHPELGRTVLHRVVGVRGDRLQLKGDANGYLDFAGPRRVDVVGKLWLRLPAAGGGVEWLRSPGHAAATAVVLALLIGGGGSGFRRRRARRALEATVRRHPQLAGSGVETAVLGLGAAAVVLLGLGVLAVAKPAFRTVAADGLYRHTGSFSYGGEAPRGEVYPAGRVGSGETVFVRIVPSVRVAFDYRLESREAREVFGTASLVARVQGDNGWTRELPIAGRRAFEGDRVRVAGELDLRGLLALGDRVAEATGTSGDSYLVTVAPLVRVGGSVDEHTISDAFAPSLALRLDRQRLRLERPGSLDRAEAGAGVREESNRLSALGFGLPVDTARVLGVGGGLLTLLAATLLWLLLQAARRGGEPTRIAGQLGPWLVDVSPQERTGPVHDLTSIDDLVRLAERYERVILHERRGSEHTYLVEEAGAVYRYVALDLSPHPLEEAGPRLVQVLRAALGR